jgi:hypothetical protein
MKDSKRVNTNSNSSGNSSLLQLPLDIQTKSLLPSFDIGTLFTLTLVSKEAYHLVKSSYKDWFNHAFNAYSTLYGEDDCHSTLFNTIKRQLAQLTLKYKKHVGEEAILKFKNHIGIILCKSFHLWDAITNELRSAIERKDEGISNFFKEQLTLFVRTHVLYLKHKAKDPLSLTNHHERDCNIVFNGENDEHYYNVCIISKEHGWLETIHSDHARAESTKILLGSVTTFIHKDLFNDFDEDVVIREMHASPRWTQSHYYPMTMEEIKAQWKEDRESGTAMHHNLEDYYNCQPFKDDSREFELFQRYENDHIKGRYVPFRTEWWIYDLELRIVGAIDLLYISVNPSKDGKIHLRMVDYKRARNVSECNWYGKTGIAPPTEHMHDTNVSHYLVQLCIYKMILEKYYNVIIDDMFLLFLHPTQSSYISYPVLWHQPFMDSLIQFRKEKLCLDGQ